MMKDYKAITLADILVYVQGHPQQFPDGLNTVILSGDFEGNYTHRKHQLQYCGKYVCLGYEMHEGGNR